MSLAVWLPLNGDLHNQGLSNITVTNSGATVDNNGKIGKCYYFNGSSYIKITMPDNMITLYNTSVCAWIKSTSATVALGGISNDVNYTVPMCTLYTSGWQFGNAAQNGYRYLSGGTIANTNIWHHVACTISGNLITTYLDGVKVTSGKITGPVNFTNNNFIEIGCDHPGGDEYLTGYVNDFRVYDHCLSAKEVEEIAKGLVLHYKLDQGSPNLLSKYVTPGQAAPGSTASGGRTIYNGDYSIIIPASENADTYFRLFLTKQLTQGNTYTISCYVSGLLSGSSYNFPLFAQGNTSMGILQLNHNGLCSLTFTMNSSAQNAVTTPDGSTVYVCFLDDSSRTLASGQGQIILSGFKLEEGNLVTSWSPSSLSSTIYDSSGYNNNGTIVGSLETTTPSPRYSCATKMTNGQYIRVNNKPAVCMPKDAITVNLWQYAISWANPISCTEGGGWNFETSNGIRFPIYISGVGYKVAQSSITPASTQNAWHMLTGTMDKDNIKIYYDGEEVGTVANGSTNGIGYANNYIFIGAEAQGDNTSPASSSYAGSLSDVRIYATALTEKQIKELYNTSMAIDNQGNIHARELVEI